MWSVFCQFLQIWQGWLSDLIHITPIKDSSTHPPPEKTMAKARGLMPIIRELCNSSLTAQRFMGPGCSIPQTCCRMLRHNAIAAWQTMLITAWRICTPPTPPMRWSFIQLKNLSCASFQAWGAYKKRSLRSAWVSAVDLCHEWSCLFIFQNWSDFPVETFRPFSSMFITSIGIIRFDQNPTLDRAWSMETLPWFALREGSTSCQEFSCSNFVVSGFERPVHQKGHWRWVVYFAYFPTTWVKKPVKDDTLVVKTIGEMLSSSVNSVPAPHRPWAGQIISRCSVTQRNLISVVARWFPSWSGTYQWILVFPILIKFRFLLCFFLVK